MQLPHAHPDLVKSNIVYPVGVETLVRDALIDGQASSHLKSLDVFCPLDTVACYA